MNENDDGAGVTGLDSDAAGEKEETTGVVEDGAASLLFKVCDLVDIIDRSTRTKKSTLR